MQKHLFPRLSPCYLGKHYDSVYDRKGRHKDFRRVATLLNTRLPDQIDSSFRDEFMLTLESSFEGGLPRSGFLYSNEGLCGSYAESFRNGFTIGLNIKDLFPNAKILFIFRRQDTFLESLYRQAIRNGHSIGPMKFVNFKNGEFGPYRLDYRANQDIKHLDWRRWVLRYRRFFGEPNVLAMPYEAFEEDSRTFIERLCRFFDSPCVYPVCDKRENSSDTGFLLRSMRIVNWFVHKKVSNMVGRVLPTGLIRSSLNGICFDPPFFSAKLRRQIMDYHYEGNKELSELLDDDLSRFGYHDNKEFFPDE